MKHLNLGAIALGLSAVTIISCQQDELVKTKETVPIGLVVKPDTTTSVYQRIVSIF